MKHLLHPRFIFSIALIYTVGIVFLSLKSIPTAVLSFKNQDKINHLLAYSVLFIAWRLYSDTKKYSKKHLPLLIALSTAVFGVLMECAQSLFTLNRVFDFYDILANITGVILGYFLYKYLRMLVY